MRVFSLRTKLEVVGLAILLVSISIASVFAVTRTITSSSDTFDTYIRNSNGKYWSVSEANIQAAIDDLGEHGWKNGIVWVAGNQTITINTGLVLKEYMTLDLQGSYLTVKSNVDGVAMAEGSCLRGGVIDTRDYVGTYTHAAILFSADEYSSGNTRVQNMYLQGAINEGSGIEYRLDTQGDVASFTSCSNIQIYKFKYGILINVSAGADTGDVTYANANTFTSIQMISPQYGIYLHRKTTVIHNQCGCDGNMFDNIHIQTGPNTERAIYAEGRYNIFDNIFLWDWGTGVGTYAYEFPTDSSSQFLTFFGGPDAYISNGTNCAYVDMELGQYKMLRYSQAAEPDIPNNTMVFWTDTDAGPKYYIIQDFAGTQKKAELT